MIPSVASWVEDVYFAKKSSVTVTSGDQTVVYSTPTIYKANVAVLGDDTRIEMFGANTKKMYRLLIRSTSTGLKEYDVAYLEGASPTGETVSGSKSNCVVRRVSPGKVATVIYLESINGK